MIPFRVGGPAPLGVWANLFRLPFFHPSNPLYVMAMTRHTGGQDFDLLRREMDQLFGSFFPARGQQHEEGASALWAPRTDLAETEDAFVLSMDLPGIKAEDVDVTFEDGTLKVSGERNAAREQEGGQYHRIERSYGRFFRSFRFGANADPDRIEASFDDGVLTIRVGKMEESKPRRIEVGSRRSEGENVSVN